MFNKSAILVFLFVVNFNSIKSTPIHNQVQEPANQNLNQHVNHNSDQSVVQKVNQAVNFNENSTKTVFEEYEDVSTLENKKALELYKLIMIFTCCILAIVLVCFLICILRNSDVITSNNTSELNLNDIHALSDENSVNTQNSSNLLVNLPFEKPPTYFETLKQIQLEIGHPPPDYTIDSNSSFDPNKIVNRNQSELVLDVNRLVHCNNERSNLELIIANQNREQLRRLSRDLERCNIPHNQLARSHSINYVPIIRNNLLSKDQHFINLTNQQPPS